MPAADYVAAHTIPVPDLVNPTRPPRPSIVGPPAPEPPYPIRLVGPVQKGFGRGGKDLGCPTANLPDSSITPLSTEVEMGVLYGYAQIVPLPQDTADYAPDDLRVLPMVMSLGWNPFYKNEKLTAEIHIMHDFRNDFYGQELRAVVLGYIRPELDYISREALIKDIDFDKQVALNCLKRPEYERYSKDPSFNY